MRTALAVLLLAVAALAQDFVKLTDGKRLRGDVIEESETTLRVVDQMGVLHVVSRKDVDSIKRGKPISKRVQRKLDAADAASPEALFAVAEWAAKTKSSRRDAKRVARRVLVIDAGHPGARALLGHVKALETWYPDEKTARKAVAVIMKKDGYVFVNGGWIREIQQGDLAAAPHRYVLVDGFVWRLYAEVMTERGLVPWKREWYPKEQQPLLDECARVLERTKATVHVGQVGACRVYCHLGRKEAEESAANIDKARQWYVKTFEIDVASRPLDREPIAVNYVLDEQASLQRFVDSYTELGFDPASLALSLPRMHATWSSFGFVIHTGENLWRQHLVSQMGGNMANKNWHNGFLLPDWVWTACAHHAEIAVFGRAQVQYVAPDRYGRASAVPLHAVTSIDGWRELMRDAYQSGDVSSLRELFRKHFNELTATDDIMGVTFLAYLLDERKQSWLDFLRKSGSTVETHFARHLGDWSQVEHDFKQWLKQPDKKKR